MMIVGETLPSSDLDQVVNPQNVFTIHRRGYPAITQTSYLILDGFNCKLEGKWNSQHKKSFQPLEN